MRLSPTVSFQACIIGAHRGALLRSYGSIETQIREMSEGRSGGHAQSGSVGSSWGSMWRERRQKGREDRERLRGEEGSSLGEGSDQTRRTMSGVSGHGQYDDRDRELERLRRLVMDLELEARGRHQERDRHHRQRGNDSTGNRGEEGSSQSGTQRFQNRSPSQESHRRRNHSHSRETRRNRSRSHGYDDRGSDSPEEWRPHNVAMDAISRALQRAARSAFSDEIEWAPMPSRFIRPPFNSYDGKMDPVEHVSHYIHMMSLYAHNDALMCKVFPSSLDSMALR